VLIWLTPLVILKISLTGVVESLAGTNRSGALRELLLGRLGRVSEDRSVLLKLLSEKKLAGKVDRERSGNRGSVADLGLRGSPGFICGVLKPVTSPVPSEEELSGDRPPSKLPFKSSQRLEATQRFSSSQRSGLIRVEPYLESAGVKSDTLRPMRVGEL
jgi:hypothetical protein